MLHGRHRHMAEKIIVIGGGAAGLFATGRLREGGADVRLLEKKDRSALKVGITGKGRCNVTNDSDVRGLIANIPTNPRFLYGAFSRFDPSDTRAFFEEHGVPLKVERGGRVFPVSDKASDIVRCLRSYAGRVELNSPVLAVEYHGERGSDALGAQTDSIGGAAQSRCTRSFTVRTLGGSYDCDRVIIATGGASYPQTGSEGDGYAFARALGHTVVPPRPSLVPLVVRERWCRELQGLSLRNTALKVKDRLRGDSAVYEDFGEMLFTHFGISGPMVLSASSRIGSIEPGRYTVELDLKPALDEKMLDIRLLSDFAKYSNRDMANALGDLLPRKLIPVVIRLSGIPEHKKINTITREERQSLLGVLKHLTLTVEHARPIEEAIVTSGGIAVGEIDPRSMESRIVPGLYFAGEVIDVDAYTGGFNLQIAFSTAALAADSILASQC